MKHRHMWLRLFSALALLALTTSLVSPAVATPAPQFSAAAPQAAAVPHAVAAAPVAADPSPASVSPEEALNKIYPTLRAAAQQSGPALPDMLETQGTNPVLDIMVTAKAGMDLSAYMTHIIPTREVFEGEQDFYGQAPASQLLKIASLVDVMNIIPVTVEKDGSAPVPPEEAVQPTPKDWATLRANAEKLRAGALPWDQAKAFGDGRTQLLAQDWFEVLQQGPHKAEAAWARGFDGTGVTVAVNDDGVDWAHPDLMGRQKIYSTTITTDPNAVCGPKGCAAAYNGWPMAFSPLSQRQYVYDAMLGTHYIANGQSGSHYADTSATPTLRDCGPGVKCFDFTPLISYATPGTAHTYVISATMTKSGIVHVGTHPDESLRDYVWGEKVAVIVTDPHTAGVYDTVYVDLNDDYNFRDEKPLTKANPADPTTYNNMIAYRDLNGDGVADISGGALYFIGDGVTPLPFAWTMWFPYQAPAPSNGNLVAFDGPTASGYSHGTQCASNVVGQGVANGKLPTFGNLPGSGKPSGAVMGAAKNAHLVDVSNIYYDFTNSKIAAYTFAVYGYDGYRQMSASDTDAIQITSNSYGSSDADNDGWDYDGRYIARRQRNYAPSLSMLVSTGNGAPGYGTTTPPSPNTGIRVGASTQFGSTGWDSITSTTQIMSNDVTGWSNRGPGARGTAGVDVVANGAYAAGDEALNYYSVSTWGAPNGNLSWASWGGTSRSSPVAMGNLALLYQAYKAKNGVWPSWDVARALLKSASTDLNGDVLTQGAGSVNADRGTAVAGGWYGLYVTPDEWNPGAYQGVDYPAFAHVMTQTQAVSQTFTLKNTGIQTITASIENGNPTLISSKTFTYTVTPAMVAAMSPSSFDAPQLVIPITATAGKILSNTWWSNIAIPADTQLMVVNMRLPYSQYDANGDYNWDNRWRLLMYNWKDVNGDGYVWHDKDKNGVVNYSLSTNATIDLNFDPNWSDPATELDRWEYVRFDYVKPGGTVYQLTIHDPLTRMQDGLFLGLQRYAASTVTQTDMTFRIDFYKYMPVTWLSTSEDSAVVPPGASELFTVTATTNGTAAGIYEAAIKVTDPGGTISGTVFGPTGTVPVSATFAAHTSVIPVVMTVAPDFAQGMTFGGAAQAAAQAGLQYNNAVVRGYADWLWRAESGDWRFFFFDNKTVPAAGTKLLVKNEWADAAPHTDLDTVVMGPTLDVFSRPLDLNPASPTYNPYGNPAYYGPYTLDTVGKSPNTNTSAGIWRFNTSTGGAEDWVSAPFTTGLHLIAPHNVLFEGDKFDVPFTTTVGTLSANPYTIDLSTYADQGTQTVVVQSGLALPGMVADAYGLGGPQRFTWNVGFTGPGTIEYTYDFTVTHAAKIDIATSSPDISDIDIYLYKRTGSSWTQVASSAGPDANEHILVSRPTDGQYRLGVDNFSGPAGTVNAVFTIVQGSDLMVAGTTTGTVGANTPVTLTVTYNKAMNPGDVYQGTLLLGPTTAPGAVEIPVTIRRLSVGGLISKKASAMIAASGDLVTYTIQVQNTSQPTATFTVSDVIPANTTFITATNGATAAGSVVSWSDVVSGNVTYEWRDSDSNMSAGSSLDPVAYDWEEISAGGTLLPVVYGGNAEVTLPFNFTFDGNAYSSLYVGDAGLVTLGSSTYLTGTSVGYTLPCATCVPPTFLAVFPSDTAMSPNSVPGTTGVWYKVLGNAPNRHVVLEWVLDYGFSPIDYVVVQAVLYEGTNQIKYQYNNVAYAIAHAPWPTVGLQLDAARAVDYTAPGYNVGPGHPIKNFLAVLFNPIYPNKSFQVVTQVNAGVAANTPISNTANLRIDHVLAQAGQSEAFSSTAYVVANPAANLSASTLTAESPVLTGDNINYHFRLANSGYQLTEAVLTFTLPLSTSLLSAPNVATYNPTTRQLIWTGTVAPSESVAVEFDVTVSSTGVNWMKPLAANAVVAWGSLSQPLSTTVTLMPRHTVYLPVTRR